MGAVSKGLIGDSHAKLIIELLPTVNAWPCKENHRPSHLTFNQIRLLDCLIRSTLCMLNRGQPLNRSGRRRLDDVQNSGRHEYEILPHWVYGGRFFHKVAWWISDQAFNVVPANEGMKQGWKCRILKRANWITSGTLIETPDFISNYPVDDDANKNV
jgi:hypothetical protein